VSPPAVISALRAAQPQRIRDAVYSGSEAFSPAFALLKSLGHPDSYMSQSLAVGWSMASCMPTLLSEEELLGIWQAHARVKVAVGNDLRRTAPRPGVSWVTAFDGTGFIALTDRRMVGIVLRGDGLTGTFDRDYETGIALWCMRLDHCSSVSAELVGHRPGLILSSAKPAGYATLTEISPGDVAGDQAVASSAPEHIAGLIEQASARFSPSMPD